MSVTVELNLRALPLSTFTGSLATGPGQHKTWFNETFLVLPKYNFGPAVGSNLVSSQTVSSKGSISFSGYLADNLIDTNTAPSTKWTCALPFASSFIKIFFFFLVEKTNFYTKLSEWINVNTITIFFLLLLLLLVLIRQGDSHNSQATDQHQLFKKIYKSN